MRASFVFSEVITGLRRNITMTIAMILTTAISLGLLGGGLLIVRMIDKMQLIYSDKVQVIIAPSPPPGQFIGSNLIGTQGPASLVAGAPARAAAAAGSP